MLRHRITFQNQVQNRQASGALKNTYQDLITLRAHKIPGGGSEGMDNDQLASTTRCSWIIRKATQTITATMLLKEEATGQIHLVDAVEDFFPDYAGGARRYLKVFTHLTDTSKR